MYGVAPYYLGKVIIEIPPLLIAQMLFTCIVYFGIGLSLNAWLFLRFFFAMLVISFTASAFGHFISVLFTQPESAVSATPVFMMPLIILGGFIANAGTIPEWIAWLQYISPVRYGFESLTANEFSDREDVP